MLSRLGSAKWWIALLLCSAWAWAKERVLPGAHFQNEIPLFATLQGTSKTLGEPLKHNGRLYARKNSWHFTSYQPADKVLEFYAARLPSADRLDKAVNNILFTLRPATARTFPLNDGTAAVVGEWVEIEITDMTLLNQVIKKGTQSPRTSVHISEFLAP